MQTASERLRASLGCPRAPQTCRATRRGPRPRRRGSWAGQGAARAWIATSRNSACGALGRGVGHRRMRQGTMPTSATLRTNGVEPSRGRWPVAAGERCDRAAGTRRNLGPGSVRAGGRLRPGGRVRAQGKAAGAVSRVVGDRCLNSPLAAGASTGPRSRTEAMCWGSLASWSGDVAASGTGARSRSGSGTAVLCWSGCASTIRCA